MKADSFDEWEHAEMRVRIKEEYGVPESCPICGKQLHSIITRRVGDSGVCLDCGDLLLPLVTALANGLIVRAQFFMQINMGLPKNEALTLREFVLGEINEFAPFISDTETLRRVTA